MQRIYWSGPSAWTSSSFCPWLFVILPLLKRADRWLCRLTLSSGLSDISSWSDSGCASLGGISQKRCRKPSSDVGFPFCQFLVFTQIIWLRGHLQRLPLLLVSILWGGRLRVCRYTNSHQTSCHPRKEIKEDLWFLSRSHSILAVWACAALS